MMMLFRQEWSKWTVGRPLDGRNKLCDYDDGALDSQGGRASERGGGWVEQGLHYNDFIMAV